MAKLFPFRGESARSTAEPRLVDIDDDAAEEVFAALSSDTARAILSRLYESPETASGVAEAADTSIQNARYHLEKLESAGLIKPVDTWYSSRGTEMTVYAPTNEPLVVAAGNEDSKGVLRRALERIVGAVAILALASVVIDRFAGGSGSLFGGIGREPGDSAEPATGTDAADATPAATGADPGQATETAAATQGPSAETGTTTQAPAGSSPTEGTAPTQTPPADGTRSIDGNASVTPTDSPTPSPTDSPTPTEALIEATPTTVDGAVDAALSFPPGALFFAGGMAVIAAGAVWWYWRQYRPMYGA